MKRWQAEVAGFLIMLAAVWAALALFWGQAGEAGAYVAESLWKAFGVASVAVLTLALVMGWQLARQPEGVRAWVSLVGWLAGASAMTVLVELIPWVRRWAQGIEVAGASGPARAGGLVGRALVTWLTQAVGVNGTYLVAVALLVVAAALVFHVGPSRILEVPIRGAARGAAWTVGRAGRGIVRAGRALAGRRRPPSGVSAPPAGSGPPMAPAGEHAGGRAGEVAQAAWQAAAAAGPPSGPPEEEGGGVALAPSQPRETRPALSLSERLALPRWGKERAGDSQEGQSSKAPVTVPVTGGARGNWRLPPSALLAKVPARRRPQDQQEIVARSHLLEQTLASFGIEARVVSHTRGPVVTRYEMALAPGIKISRVVNLADDLALALATTGVRIEAPVPGKPVIGIEVPNASVETVTLREVLESAAFARSERPLTLALGKDVAGEPLVGDLERVIHLLIAGATGSGKSVCLASIIMSLLFRLTPDQLRLLLIDPKRVELTVYEGIPHLLAPVVTEVRQAASALRWAVREMEARYQEMAKVGARHLGLYNQMAAEGKVAQPMPYVVVVIDELADLMLVAAADVEDSICRLAQMARAAGIHLVIATQRPSTDVITGLIKANIPSRLAFAVSSQVDSRTILDAGGAERLLGRGDMLYHPLGEPKPIRAQGCLVTEKEIEQVVRFWKEQGPPQYQVDVFEEPEDEKAGTADDDDPLYDEAVKLVTEAGQASVSMLQRRFRIGYARAARLVDMMERRGVVGPYQGSKPREVLPAYRRRDQPA
ncbi:MAG: DNA translocase FtsK 4TM domain-containing protein [Limnochordaceae bacterium]|nr:DNA translocase FtsK 4TM domain-containing protein [Limnochordaceae bacterium]